MKEVTKNKEEVDVDQIIENTRESWRKLKKHLQQYEAGVGQ
ncbi:hypothetical protein [Methanobacterium ferruginis]|nr:hypothetical protein [Methanobacterium ferruginis]BDZ68571.1 hypothetical protein GCM10025860_20190 [Methanobacterium ferruginis]